VRQQNVHRLGVLSVVPDNNARAPDDLPWVPFLVNLAKTDPLAELLGVLDLDQVDVVFGAEGFDELGVVFFVAGFREDAEVCGFPVKSGASDVR
jgi:hypothetical protein